MTIIKILLLVFGIALGASAALFLNKVDPCIQTFNSATIIDVKKTNYGQDFSLVGEEDKVYQRSIASTSPVKIKNGNKLSLCYVLQ